MSLSRCGILGPLSLLTQAVQSCLHFSLKHSANEENCHVNPQATGGLIFLARVESGTTGNKNTELEKAQPLMFFPFRSRLGIFLGPPFPPVKRGRGPFKVRPSLPQNFPVSALFDPGRPAKLAAELVGDRAKGSGRGVGGGGISGTRVAAPEGGRGPGCGSSGHGHQ